MYKKKYQYVDVVVVVVDPLIKIHHSRHVSKFVPNL